jgi:hypothetical protein
LLLLLLLLLLSVAADSHHCIGVMVFPDYLAAGIKFSWPTYKGGLRIMIYDHLQSGSTWAFAEVFHWSVWLSLCATAVVVGLLVALLEWITPNTNSSSSTSGVKPRGDQPAGHCI